MDPSPLINYGFGNGVTPSQLTTFAQLMIIGVEFLSPLFYAWNAWEESNDEATSRRGRGLDEDFDFIIGNEPFRNLIFFTKIFIANPLIFNSF